VVCDGGPNTLVTSRKPADLNAFCEAALDAFSG
jgi:protease I